MLWNPQHDHKPLDLTEPSLAGFALFVAFKQLRDPDERYDYMSPDCCAVGEYLHALNGYYTNWHTQANTGSLLYDLDELSQGGKWRDARGRFTANENKVGKQWTYRALGERLRRAVLAAEA